MMDPYKASYFLLFNSMTDAVKALDALNIGQAKDLLVRAQQAAEELFLEQEEETADDP